MSRLYDPQALTPAEFNGVQRQQFRPLSENHQEWYNSQRIIYDAYQAAEMEEEKFATIDDFLKPFGEDQLKKETRRAALDEMAIVKNGVMLTKRDLSIVINSLTHDGRRTANRSAVSNEYCQMICKYINPRRRRAYGEKEKVIPSCLSLTSEEYSTLIGKMGPRGAPPGIENRAADLWRERGITSARNFNDLDFLLIPYVQYGAHSFLLGISPKQRIAFVVDSVANNFDWNHDTVRGLRALIYVLSPDYSFAPGNRNAGPGQWRIYGQWSARSRTTDLSPDAAQQSDDYNCGIFVSTYAFCLAFGFDLDCFNQKDIVDLKKPRMAAEFVNGGLEGISFDYDLLLLPQIGYRRPPFAVHRMTQQEQQQQQQRDQEAERRQEQALRQQRQARRHQEQLAELEAKEARERQEAQERARRRRPAEAAPTKVDRQPSRIKTGLKRFFSRTKNGDKSESSDAEQRGLGDDSGYEDEEELEIAREGSDGESDDEDDLPFEKQPLYTHEELQYYLKTKPNPAGIQRKDNTPYPAQFNPEVHDQAVLIYALPDGFKYQDRTYSKRELKQVCRDFQIRGWESWSFESQGFFMKFVMSEVAARIARGRGDQVLPFPGIRELPGWKAGPKRPLAENAHQGLRRSKRRKMN